MFISYCVDIAVWVYYDEKLYAYLKKQMKKGLCFKIHGNFFPYVVSTSF